jgi:hypothetical protein
MLELLRELLLIWLVRLAKMSIGKCLQLNGRYLAIPLGHYVVESSQSTIDKIQVKYD